MLVSDLFSLTLAFLYVAALIGIAETLRRVFHVPRDVTRKIVHVGVGMTALAVTFIFRDWTIAIIGPLTFIVVNYFSYRRNLFRGIETGETGQLGTVYFPLSFVLLTPLLWSRPALLAAAFMPMAWGDAAAAILGKRLGAHQFSLFGQVSSVEGSIAMFVLSLIATNLVLVLFGQPVDSSVLAAFLTASVATLLEALSPWGLDNLTVPIVSAFVLSILIK